MRGLCAHSFFRCFKLISHATLNVCWYDEVVDFMALFLMRVHMVYWELDSNAVMVMSPVVGPVHCLGVHGTGDD